MRKKPYKLTTKLDFGKYKGKRIKKVLKLNPSYIEWCINNVASFYVTQKVFDKLKKALDGAFEDSYIEYDNYTYDVDYDYDDPFIWDNFVNG